MNKAPLAFAVIFSLFTFSAMAKTYKVEVTEKGFVPDSIETAVGEEVTLEITRKTEATCAKNVLIASKKIKKDLPMNKPVEIKLGKLALGKVRFSCGMEMLSGVVITK